MEIIQNISQGLKIYFYRSVLFTGDSCFKLPDSFSWLDDDLPGGQLFAPESLLLGVGLVLLHQLLDQPLRETLTFKQNRC